MLCTTSTLAMGVNLPARLVVLKGTRRYVGSEAEDSSGYQEYERSTCLQARAACTGVDRSRCTVCCFASPTCGRLRQLCIKECYTIRG